MSELDIRKGLGSNTKIDFSRSGSDSSVYRYKPEPPPPPATKNKNKNNKSNNNKSKVNSDKYKTLDRNLSGPYANLKDGYHFIPGDKWHQAKWSWVVNGHAITGAEALAIKTYPHIKKVVKPIVKHLQRADEIDKAKKEAIRQRNHQAVAALEIGKKVNHIRQDIQHQTIDRMISAGNPEDLTQSKHDATNLQRAEHLNRLNELNIKKR